MASGESLFQMELESFTNIYIYLIEVVLSQSPTDNRRKGGG
jgi:hypothetical protein